ncbi:hypothetical protein MPSEU_000119300 [Mayamaea pseudoterrestris]|nr:hypothetical protein MPSEU_000119300 [Mayamaea pseudoterrestris]
MIILLYLIIFIATLLFWVYMTRRRNEQKHLPRSFGFFHPFCSSGGGGERVLWHLIQVLLQQEENIQIIIYTVDKPTEHYKTDLLRKIETQFSVCIKAPDTIEFVHLHQHLHLLQPAQRFSMLVESFNTMRLAYVALQRRVPHVWVDTTGCAFTYGVAKCLFRVRHVLAYVHYPTVSTDMLQLVYEQRKSQSRGADNNIKHARSTVLSMMRSMIKCIYYCFFALLYSVMGGCFCDCVLVNSTWTYHHMHSLWWYAAMRRRIKICYPPCGTLDGSVQVATTQSASLQSQSQQYIISIGQFRPEKNHMLQLQVMAALLRKYSALQGKVQLVVIGSCRNQADKDRLAQLQALATQLRLNEHDAVTFVVNEPYAVVQNWLNKARVGLHTMWNEHFGIGIVEMMAAGVITVAHDSGGPQSDIVVPWNGQATGFLATTVDDYVEAIYDALTMPADAASRMRAAARASTRRFTDAVFAESIEKRLREAKLIK